MHKWFWSCFFIFVQTWGLYAERGEEKLYLVWQMGLEGIWEADWISELLSGLNYEVVIDGKYEQSFDRSLVVVSGNPGDYFSQMRRKNYRFGIIHLSDETYSAPTDYYGQADFVLRNYWHKKFANQKGVFHFALGYKSGFWKGLARPLMKTAQERLYNWSFAGQIIDHPTRAAMVQAMRQIPFYHFYEIFTWNDSGSLSTIEYRDLLLDSIFVPCGTGYFNLDSFRVYEALECGCIPIVEKTPIDYFTLLFGEHPFISISSWDEAPEIIEKLLEDPDQLEDYRRRCYQWWLDYKEKTRSKIRGIIEDQFNLGLKSLSEN